jgi:acetyl esterase/lipase
MVTVPHNTVALCGTTSIEAGQVAARSERLRIEDNVIRDAKKEGISLINVHGAIVRRNAFESVTSYFAPTDRYSPIVLNDCTDIRLSDEIIKDQRARSTNIGRETASLDKISLWANNAPIGEGKFQRADATLTVHRAKKPNGAAMIICPGGGYGGLVVGSEGHGTARWLNEHGVTGIVLEYRLPNGKSLVPMLDAQRAIRTVRTRAAEWGIDPRRIGIIGFSAGGHVASTAGTHFDAGNPQAADAIERVSCRPDFMVLVYPVISMGEKAHMGSRANLLGKEPTPELIELFSNDKQITRDTPPAFLTHALNDMAVVPENSRMFHEALKANGVATQYLELPSGGHGLSDHKGPMWEAWQKQSLEWLVAQKIIPAPEATPAK